MARNSTSARPLTDHEEIRQWAEERGAKPACVTGTGGGDDVGMIRLDFPGYSGGDSLEEISWDEWFDKFDESKLALLVQDETAKGQQSNFNKLVKRETAAHSERTQRSSKQRASANGRSKSRSQGSRGQARVQASGRDRSSATSASGSRSSNAGRNSSASRRNNGSASGRKASSRTIQARGRKGPQKTRRGESRRRAA